MPTPTEVQTPTIVFDFTTRRVEVVGIDPDAARKLQGALVAQRDVAVTAGGIPPEQGETR